MPALSFTRFHSYKGLFLVVALAISFLAVYHSFERSTVWWTDVAAARVSTLALARRNRGTERFGFDRSLCPGSPSKADRGWPISCNASKPLSLQRPFCRKRWKEERLKDADLLPREAVDEVRYFVLFIGHAHSGTSITGALLDAHPNVVLANEHYTLHQLVHFPRRYPARGDLYDSLFARERSKAVHFQESSRKGYSLYVNASAMGRYEGRLRVIGDKAAGATVGLYLTDPAKFQDLLHQLRELVGVPLKFVHVIRNPFDTIASAYIYKVGGAKLRADLMQQPDPASQNSSATPNKLLGSNKLDCSIQDHFEHTSALEKMRTEMGLDVLQVQLPDLVRSPSSELGRICSFLDLECGHRYLEACQAALFKELSQTRDKVLWSQSQITIVEQLAGQVPSLERYSFSSE